MADRTVPPGARRWRRRRQDRPPIGRGHPPAKEPPKTIEALTGAEPEQALNEVTCPACRQPAEIRDRRVLGSTNGPIEHIKTRCDAGHMLTQIVERDAPPG